MSEQGYNPPKVWQWDSESGGKWASINRPIAGSTHEKDLPKGQHPFQLYSLATPNGQKATILFEELLELGISDAEYDAWLIRIDQAEQFGSGFVALNPNSKIPALWDSRTQTRVFESGAILLYLAEQFQQFLPKDAKEKAEAINWLFWLQGAAPYLGGGFGHFYAYAPEKFEYPINRFTMEVKRQLDLLDKRLAEAPYLGGQNYSIADIATWPWYGQLVQGKLYEAAEFLDVTSYQHVTRWAKQIAERPAVQRGIRVNKVWGPDEDQLPERHSKDDF